MVRGGGLGAGERECLFAPCSFLEPTGGEAVEVTPHGVVCKLRVRLNANTKAPTLAELRGRRRAMHLAAFAHANAETARELERIAREGRIQERLQSDPLRICNLQSWLQWGGKEADLQGCVVAGGEVTFTAEGYLGYLRRGLAAARDGLADAAKTDDSHDTVAKARRQGKRLVQPLA